MGSARLAGRSRLDTKGTFEAPFGSEPLDRSQGRGGGTCADGAPEQDLGASVRAPQDGHLGAVLAPPRLRPGSMWVCVGESVCEGGRGRRLLSAFSTDPVQAFQQLHRPSSEPQWK